MRKPLSLALAFASAAAVASFAGCSSNGVIGSTAATLVARYCAAPEIGRAALREVIAASTAPNRISVECAADAL